MREILLEFENSDEKKRVMKTIEKVMQLHKPKVVTNLIIKFDDEMSGGDDYFAEVTFVCPNIEPLFFQFDEDSIKEVIKDALFYWGQALKKTVKEYTGKNIYFTDKNITY
jgi:hypothetical protein